MGLELAFIVNDLTAGCAVGAEHTFEVSVNGLNVGAYFFTTPDTASSGTISLSPVYAFAPIAGTGASSDEYAIRMTATSDVCNGGDSWMWNPGGVATARP